MTQWKVRPGKKWDLEVIEIADPLRWGLARSSPIGWDGWRIPSWGPPTVKNTSVESWRAAPKAAEGPPG